MLCNNNDLEERSRGLVTVTGSVPEIIVTDTVNALRNIYLQEESGVDFLSLTLMDHSAVCWP